MAEKTVGEALESATGAASSAAADAVESLPTDAITPEALKNVIPTDAKCPPLPGITFPELPDVSALGEIADDALEKVNALKERVKNPPSADDMAKEFSSKVSGEVEKAKKALDKAANEIEKQVKAQAAAAWDKLQETATDLENALTAIEEGVIDIASLGMSALELPAKILEGAFAGFKNAAECLKGVAGSAEEAFNKTAPALDESLSNKGRGLSAIAKDEEILHKIEEKVDEYGNDIKVSAIITPEQAKEDAEGTTREVVPFSEKPLEKRNYQKREEEAFTPTNVLSDVAAQLGFDLLAAGIGVNLISEHSKHGGYSSAHVSIEHAEDRAIDIGTGLSFSSDWSITPRNRQAPIVGWLQTWSQENGVSLEILWTDNYTKHDDHIHVGVLETDGLTWA